MKHFFVGVILLVLLSPLALQAQNVQATEYMNAGKYTEAINMLEVSREKGNAELTDLVNLAYCYIMMHDYVKAESVYAEVVKDKKAGPRQYFFYGEVSRINGKYGEAKQWYQEFLKSFPLDRIALLRIKSCDSLQFWAAAKPGVTIQNVSEVNTPEDELCPSLAQGALTFVSNSREYLTKTATTTQFTDPQVSFLYVLNPGGTIQSFRPFSDSVSYTYCSGGGGKQALVIKTVKRTPDGEKFGPSVMMTGTMQEGFIEFKPEGLPQGYICTHPCVANNGSRLYFSSNIPGGFGGVDLYYADYSNGSWSAPVNLGPAVNTPGDEMFPSVSSDGQQLYFASDGHPGYGNLDIFCSVLSSGQWGAPRNLRAPVNSIGNDFGWTTGSAYTGYFVSNRHEGSMGRNDLYAYHLPEPVAIPVDTVKPPVVQTVPSDKSYIFFNTASAMIDPVFEDALNRMATQLKEKPYLKLNMTTWADARGAEALNVRLCDERAAAVTARLVAKGIDASRILAKPSGTTSNTEVVSQLFHVQIGYMPTSAFVGVYQKSIKGEVPVSCIASGKGYAYVAGLGTRSEMQQLRQRLEQKYGLKGYVTASYQGYYMSETHFAPCRRAEMSFSK